MTSVRHLALMLLIPSAAIFAQQGEKPGQTDIMGSILPMMLVMFAVIYFLMIRPEQKKQKTKQKMMEELKKGDRVLTIGGIHGTVGTIKGTTLLIKTGDNTTIEVAKSAVSTVMNKDGSERTSTGDEKK